MTLDSIASLNDARALLDTFTGEGWQTALIRVGGSEFALSRDAVLDRPAPVQAVVAAAPATVHQIKAPHVATLVEIVSVGTELEQGQRLAVLSVLGENSDLVSPIGGRVSGHGVEPGALVEYGQLLAEISV